MRITFDRIKVIPQSSHAIVRRVLLSLFLIAAAFFGTNAIAACNFSTASTSGITITLNGTGAGNAVGLCVTNDVVLWGLYGQSNGANPNIDAFNNVPLTAGGLSYSNLSYSSSKATYTLIPVPIGGDFSQVPEYTIRLDTLSSSGSDTITLWYASDCSHAANSCSGSGITNTSFTVTVNLPDPTVTSISPTAGPTAGGTSVNITGTGFTGATAVSFGGTAAASFTVNSATSITATAPAGTGTVDVRVTVAGRTSAIVAGDQFTYVAVPAVTSVSPSAGPTAGGTSVTITGTSFTGATGVNFGGTAATGFTVNSATSITATSPAGAGTVDIRVTTAGGTSATGAGDQFTYVSAPAVSSISPSAGSTAGGTSVSITGTNFTGATAVNFGGNAAASFTVNSATSITATSPAGAGTVDVRVTTAGGTTAIVGGDQFTYVAAPAVTSILPNSGPAAGGTSVSITGTGFTGATAVNFGGNAATSFTVNSATSITATAPAGTGTVDIRVTTAGGTSATGASDQFTYVAAPAITSVSPSAGPTAGGTSVTITGTNFTGATAVSFGGTAATGFTVNSATSITATSPAGAGTVDIRVTTAGGTSATGAGDQFTYAAVPAVTSISPTSGATTGGTSVTITGSGFTGATAVMIGGAAATGVTVVNATTITATTPAGAAGTANVVVTTPGGTGTGSNLFTFVVAAPTVTAISPNTGPIAGGTAVTISGTNFTGATSVTVGGAAATGVTVVSATTITATTPPGTAGAANVVVTTPGGTGTGVFTYTSRPDPSKDPEVVALLNAQVQMTKRFGQTQIGNFQNRLEGLHSRSRMLSQDRQNLSSHVPTRAPVESKAIPLSESSSEPGTSVAGSTSALFSQRQSSFTADTRCKGGMDDAAQGGFTGAGKHSDGWPWPTLSLNSSSNNLFGSGVDIWSAGTINVGRQSKDDTRFTTSGISVGSDSRVADNLIFGIGAGFGHERQKIGSSDTTSRGNSYSLVMYGSFQPTDGFFIDGLIGYGHMAFDATRDVSGTGDSARSKRNGTQWFSSLSSGYEYVDGRLLVSPYGRLDVVYSRLGTGSETGAGTMNLTYQAQTLRSTKLSLGLRSEAVLEIATGTIRPNMRLEYQRDFDESGIAKMMYSDDLTGTVYQLDMGNASRNTLVVGLGLDLTLRKSWQTGLSYKFSRGDSPSSQQHGFGVYLRRAF